MLIQGAGCPLDEHLVAFTVELNPLAFLGLPRGVKYIIF
jgi:hypothetical protein